jgi:hypothetical protein
LNANVAREDIVEDAFHLERLVRADEGRYQLADEAAGQDCFERDQLVPGALP